MGLGDFFSVGGTVRGGVNKHFSNDDNDVLPLPHLL